MLKKILAFVAMLYAAASFAAVDVNKATAAELDGIKGIGPAISGKIIDERKKGNFKDWNDFITRVQGVGEGNAAKFSAEGLTVNGAGFSGAAATPAKKDDKAATAKETKPAAKAEDKKAESKAAAPAAAASATPAKDVKTDPKAEAKAKKEAEKAAKAAKAKLDAEIEAAKPERERMVAYVRQCIDGLPECKTTIGQHMRMDVIDALSKLLTGWKADVKEAA